jgi:hypothetical protein
MKVENIQSVEKPDGYLKRVGKPFENYEGTQYVDSEVYELDGNYFLALAKPAKIIDPSKGWEMPISWYLIEGAGEPPELYNRGGYEYDGVEDFFEDVLTR